MCQMRSGIPERKFAQSHTSSTGHAWTNTPVIAHDDKPRWIRSVGGTQSGRTPCISECKADVAQAGSTVSSGLATLSHRWRFNVAWYYSCAWSSVASRGESLQVHMDSRIYRGLYLFCKITCCLYRTCTCFLYTPIISTWFYSPFWNQIYYPRLALYSQSLALLSLSCLWVTGMHYHIHSLVDFSVLIQWTRFPGIFVCSLHR